MLGRLHQFRGFACLLALAALAGCRPRASGDEILRELTAATEEMASELSRAKSVGDLEARGERLAELAGRIAELRRKARKASEASEAAKLRYEARLRAAVDRIAAILEDWSREARWDMLEYVDGLKGT